ncbi:SSI family serine proteinase inhibitor [Nocardiopsis listeri]|uniref:SSI family serine proteinase inhibitor n=1 Tax=Nocardiopsis listeri TaxID=53440 RepID=UPI00083391F1|nr:SSI family serine proteinase inhibitor [Nocardiopsis listeri]
MRTALGLVAAAALALSLASPAQAEATSYDLSLSPVSPGGVEAAETTPFRSVVLECGPAGGTHPAAQAACDLIGEAGGRVSEVETGTGGICTMIHRPVTVVADGGGERYEETFGNECLLREAKGAVFDF